MSSSSRAPAPSLRARLLRSVSRSRRFRRAQGTRRVGAACGPLSVSSLLHSLLHVAPESAAQSAVQSAAQSAVQSAARRSRVCCTVCCTSLPSLLHSPACQAPEPGLPGPACQSERTARSAPSVQARLQVEIGLSRAAGDGQPARRHRFGHGAATHTAAASAVSPHTAALHAAAPCAAARVRGPLARASATEACQIIMALA